MNEKELSQFIKTLKEFFRENLLSVVGYGSDNILIILNEISLEELAKLPKPNFNHTVWSLDELKNSFDVFPIEFQDIKANCKTLYGPDLFNAITIDTKHLRHQIEFELRSKLLKLRSLWLDLKGNKKALEDFLIQAGTSFRHLARHSQKITGQELPGLIMDPFVLCQKLKTKEIKLNTQQLETLYHGVHESVEKIIEMIERRNNP